MQPVSNRRKKAIFSGAVINLIEWFDWYVYSAFAIYFSAAFFPHDNSTVQLLQTAGIFALGFLMRPIGSWLLGVLGDKMGRKKSMLLAVGLMCGGSLIIALTPTYSQIGVFAPIILLVARLLQGFSVGGGVGVSTAYLTEMSTPSTRGFYSSFQYVTLIGGQLLALALLIVLQNWFLTEKELYEWGWRIPFFIGALLTVVIFYLKKDLHETKAYQYVKESGRAKESVLRRLFKHPKAILVVMGMTLGGTLAFYTFTTYMQKYLANTVGLSNADATMISFGSLVIYAAVHPLIGSLSDKIGRKPLLLAFGTLGTLGVIPLVQGIAAIGSPFGAFVLITAGLLIVSLYSSLAAVVKAEVFPAEVRAIGVGLPHAVTVAVFGGTAEYAALWFKSIGHESWYYWYVTAGISLSLLLFVCIRDTKKGSKLDSEPDG